MQLRPMPSDLIHGLCHAVARVKLILIVDMGVIVREGMIGARGLFRVCCLGLADSSAAEVQHALQLAVVQEEVERPEAALLTCAQRGTVMADSSRAQHLEQDMQDCYVALQSRPWTLDCSISSPLPWH